MTLSVIIALSSDRRTGRVLSGVLPADKAISQVKQAIQAGECPDPAFPILRAVKLDECLREFRFRVAAGAVAAQPVADTAASPSSIPVPFGAGEDAVIINVATEAEAQFLRGIAMEIEAGDARVKDLEAQLFKANTKQPKQKPDSPA